MNFFYKEPDKLIVVTDAETVWLEPWGRNALRMRSTKNAHMMQEDWALLPGDKTDCTVELLDKGARITNGKIRAEVSEYGRITYYNQKNEVLLDEFWRSRVDNDAVDPAEGAGNTHQLDGIGCSQEIPGREFKGIPGGDYKITVRFKSEPKEKLFGMGQYQQPYLDIKNTELELAQRNSQASVPFLISSLGYGFLWNNPALGRASFCKNMTTWVAECSDGIDYWICAEDSPKAIEETYASVTGTVPMMPDWGMGFWQCKLRYQTQEELLEVAREYKRRGLPIDLIVIDCCHWTMQGEWKFDPTYWPDPQAMVDELKSMGIELMVSVWPTVHYNSENYFEMKNKGLLLRYDQGFPVSLVYQGNNMLADCTNPETQKFMWEKAKENYYKYGIKVYWLDLAEPEFTNYSFDIVRNHYGPHIKTGNYYPVGYAKAYYDGLTAQGEEKVMNLLRCAWAGSQRYGALVWSGDIYSSYESMRCQVAAGLNMGIAGIPWWTTDIGGFFGGDPDKEEFRDLLARWFEYGAFCPVMRIHGFRVPVQPQVGTTGGCKCLSGAANEVWSYGPELYEICVKYLNIREQLKPYTASLMQEAHEKGSPVMRTLFYEFPDDPQAWEINDQYLYGSKLLVAPVLEQDASSREVYLPAGACWTNVWTEEVYEGGQTITVAAPRDTIPVFRREEV